MDRLILCGAGHVSLEVAHMAQRLELAVVVIDDREEFANVQRFPMAQQVICAPFHQALADLGSREGDYFVIVTRGHIHDKDCLAQILRGKHAYVGMIGSKVKVSAVMSTLQADGVPQDILDGVFAPIGLPIGGQTPAEIALSILAQVVQVRNSHGPSIIVPPSTPGVLVTITKKHGSAPRGAGAWMLVLPDGTCAGTIGGGAVEHHATEYARQLWIQGGENCEKTYDLSQHAADLGMVCGGTIDVRFEVTR